VRGFVSAYYTQIGGEPRYIVDNDGMVAGDGWIGGQMVKAKLFR
jgi:hypothetical protein